MNAIAIIRRGTAATLMAVLALGNAAFAQAINAATLQRLLQSTPRQDVRFTESRESPWLSAPVSSSGVLSASPTMLEKRVEQPRRETWRILEDRMQWSSPGSGATKDILFTEVPAAAALANAMRNAMAGDLAALDKDFQLVFSGDERLWTVQMKARRPEVSRQLKQLELQGSQGRLQVLIIEEAKGDRTITRLQYEKKS
jgi:hypothetical protein